MERSKRQKLYDLRIKLGYSRTDMGKLLDISKVYYWQIENKQRNLSYRMAFQIAEILGSKPDELFYDEFKKDPK